MISDIDGTITKSDVLGHVIPAIGGTWAHAGVAELYTRIKNNGLDLECVSSQFLTFFHIWWIVLIFCIDYFIMLASIFRYKMVYLSSRAIGQSHTTKQYLKSIAQDSKQLPDGPVLLSPTSVLIAFRRYAFFIQPTSVNSSPTPLMFQN